ncbi:caspase family protein [Curvibacter gracilis]|uniref:caspase family protein n=1 Tax=Curvibacter gracilis TaxID=230310 RepID=UPI000A0284FE|nr:caspase family protein [Curvibacter gracilis]
MKAPGHISGSALALTAIFLLGLPSLAQQAVPAAPSPPPAQVTQLLRASEMRADKLPTADVLATLPTGATVQVRSLEGGWAQVSWQESSGADSPGRPSEKTRVGWVRAGALNLQVGNAQAATLLNGRTERAHSAMTLGVRNLPARDNRHALIIGISRYADPRIPELPGTHVDRESATQMAQAMQVPPGNITYLQDEAATGDGIRKALQELSTRIEEGDRVFLHYSGHGTRYKDAQAGNCVEALLAYDGGPQGTVTNREMADLLKPIVKKSDKLFVMYDACHSGGIVQTAQTVRTRGFQNSNDEGVLRPKFVATSDECSRPVNVKGRNLAVEQTEQGALAQDIIYVSASRDNEVSFDDEEKGGLATQYMRDCMLRDAQDLDGSGAVSVDEIRQCAQGKLNQRMQNDALFKPHNITLHGNSSFVPTWFHQPVSEAMAAAVPQAEATSQPAPVQQFTGEQALRQIFDQRDAKRQVRAQLNKAPLKIGQDFVDLQLNSSRDGYLYVVMAGSDNRSLYLLFPNELDRDNKVSAGASVRLPRPHWRLRASGPAGTDSLLVMVTDQARDLAPLRDSPYTTKAGPFVKSLNDAQGRAALGYQLLTGSLGATGSCAGREGRNAQRSSNTGPACSDAYGAALLSVEEKD